jgi:serine/threonine-protein kinase RsbW
MEKRIERVATLENLQALRDFVTDACRACGGDSAACDALELAVDEACTNVVVHGYDGLEPGPMELIVRCDANGAEVTIMDHGHGFSPDDIPAPDLDSPWQERQVGGLGWHIIQQMMDGVAYQADAQAGNRLVLRKRLRTED